MRGWSTEKTSIASPLFFEVGSKMEGEHEKPSLKRAQI
jgi:hypothetical protein